MNTLLSLAQNTDFTGVVPVVGGKQELKTRLNMIKQQRHGSIGAGLATALAVAALACATFTRAQAVPGGSGEAVTSNNGIRSAAPGAAPLDAVDGIAGRDMRAMSSQDVAPGVAAPDSVEGQLRSEGKRWARASGPIQVDTYVQDIVANRINQPAGRGRIGKVKTIDEYLGVEHAWVDFGRGYVLHIRTSELSRIRFVASEMPPPAPDMAAPDSVEGQLRAEGKRWERTSDAIQAGAYVQDIKQDRLNQPKGRGTIGKVLSVDEYLGAPHSWVDFGRGYVLHIRMSELATIRIVAPEMPSAAPGMISGGPARPGFIAPDNAAPDSVEGQMRSRVSAGNGLPARSMREPMFKTFCKAGLISRLEEGLLRRYCPWTSISAWNMPGWTLAVAVFNTFARRSFAPSVSLWLTLPPPIMSRGNCGPRGRGGNGPAGRLAWEVMWRTFCKAGLSNRREEALSARSSPSTWMNRAGRWPKWTSATAGSSGYSRRNLPLSALFPLPFLPPGMLPLLRGGLSRAAPRFL